jgi:ribosomal protein S6--L-glutamate ligase
VIDGQVFTPSGQNLSALSVLYHMNADEQSAHQNDILRAIENSGVTVINTWGAFMACRDKFFANQILRQNGICVPPSALLPSTASAESIHRIFDQFGGRVIFKPRDNHGAVGIMMFTHYEEFVDFIQATKGSFTSYYIEKFIDFGAHDYRVEIFNGAVIGGYSRGKAHRLKTNISQGGAMLPIQPNKEHQTIALAAAQALGITTTIVDMIQSLEDGQTYVLEVNPIMGIFVEAGMRAGTKTTETEPHPGYSNDDRKLACLTDYLVQCVRAAQNTTLEQGSLV